MPRLPAQLLALLLASCTLPPFQAQGKRCDGPAACPDPLFCARGLDGVARCSEAAGVTVDLDFVSMAQPPPVLRVSRGSSASVMSSNGRVRDVSCNDGGCEARLDFDAAGCVDAGGDCARPRGLLIEPVRTNLVENSATLEGFSNGPAGSGHLDAGVDVAPDGAGATVLTDATASPTPPAYFWEPASVDDGANYTASIYVKKKKGADPCGTGVGVWAPPMGSRGVTVNAVTGALRTWAGAPAAYGVADMGGWWRLWARANAGTGNSEIRIALLPDNDWVCERASTTVWGAQLEKSEHPTSWVRTVRGPATRGADVVALPVGPWLDPARGTVYVEVEVPYATSAASPVVTLSDTTGREAFALGRRFAVRLDGGLAAELGAQLPAPAVGVHRFAFAWESGRQALYADDVSGGQAVQTVLPRGLSQLSLGSDPAQPGAALDGYVRRVVYWPVPLEDSALEELSRSGLPRSVGAAVARLEVPAGATRELAPLVFGGTPPYVFSRASGEGMVTESGRFTASSSGVTRVKVTDAAGAWVGLEVRTP